MKTDGDVDNNLTLNELNNYIQSLREWIESAKTVQQQNYQAFQDVVRLSNQRPAPNRVGLIQFVIPPLWKRFAAETIDFILLFTLKLYLTFLLFYNFDFPLADKEELISILENPEKVAAVSAELAVLEVLYRVLACIYETYWLHGAEPASPGKFLLGLRVYCTEEVVTINENENPVLLVNPGSLGWAKSFWRAILKNILLGLVMFPMCFGMFISRHNRTVYDLLVGTVVVEHNPEVRVIPQNVNN
ncbi:protein FAM8A1 isoform X2 [Onthophagus taurus]|uniref:protein FAM8A1 isoform X2 n=1 Tax=Onthophagus taurus TaxID=166361 RepID=UPI000C20D5E4|nr:protein FAM8A1 isoform X2 [Onthophagus taurus]